MNRRTLVTTLRFISILLLIVLAIWLINRYGIEQLRASVDRLGVWAPIAVFALRATSIVIPALPGTAYSLLAGGLFGFSKGLAVICLADLVSCSLSFWLSRRYGRTLVQRLVGWRFTDCVDRLSL